MKILFNPALFNTKLNSKRNIKSSGITNFNNPNDIYANPNSEQIRANYLSFLGNGFRTVGKTQLTDRITGEKVNASVRKMRAGTTDFYKLFVKNQEAGFMTIDCDSSLEKYIQSQDMSEESKLSSLHYSYKKNVPEILMLRSILGDKYSGIGTELMKVAIEQSLRAKKGGNLFLNAEAGYAWAMSDYRSGENPIPFYYKMGFCAPNVEDDAKIQKALKTHKYDELPPSQLLLLTPQARNEWLFYLAEHPVLNS